MSLTLSDYPRRSGCPQCARIVCQASRYPPRCDKGWWRGPGLRCSVPSAKDTGPRFPPAPHLSRGSRRCRCDRHPRSSPSPGSARQALLAVLRCWVWKIKKVTILIYEKYYTLIEIVFINSHRVIAYNNENFQIDKTALKIVIYIYIYFFLKKMHVSVFTYYICIIYKSLVKFNIRLINWRLFCNN